jgi:xylulokinase
MFPFLMGARSVRWNADARGLLLGLSLGHTRGDIARAIMEGVGYEVGKCLEGLRDLGLAPGEVWMGGGAIRPLARIKADPGLRSCARATPGGGIAGAALGSPVGGSD